MVRVITIHASISEESPERLNNSRDAYMYCGRMVQLTRSRRKKNSESQPHRTVRFSETFSRSLDQTEVEKNSADIPFETNPRDIQFEISSKTVRGAVEISQTSLFKSRKPIRTRMRESWLHCHGFHHVSFQFVMNRKPAIVTPRI
jgi:hypothetical protein